MRGGEFKLNLPTPLPKSGQTTDAPGPFPTTSTSVSPPASKQTLVSMLQSHVEEHHGRIVDIRNPDVLRITPVAQYTTFVEVWKAVQALKESLETIFGL